MKGQLDENGEKILLGDNTRGETVTQWPVILQGV